MSNPAVDEVRLSDLLAALLRRWKLIALTLLVSVLVAVAVLMALPRRYVARTVMVPPAEQGSSALVAALADMPVLPGITGGTDPRQNLITTIVQSRSISDSIVARIRANPDGVTATPRVVRRVVEKKTKVDANVREGFVAVEVSAPTPRLAYRVASEYPELVNQIATGIGAQLSVERQRLLERQIATASEALLRSEQQLLSFQQRNDAPDPQEQARATVGAAADLQQAVFAQELRVNTLRRTLTPNHPDLRAAESELGTLRGQLRRLTQGTARSGDVFIPLGSSPELRMFGQRVLREFARNEQIYTSLMGALAQAQIEAGTNLPIVGVLDAPEVPGMPAPKPRAAVLVAALTLGLVLGVVLALMAEYASRVRHDPDARNLASAWGAFRDDLRGMTGRRRRSPGA